MCECVIKNIDWGKFRSSSKGKTLDNAKNAYIEFFNMLNEVDFELVSDYFGNQEKVKLVYKLDDSVKLNINPNAFKSYTYKSIVNFKKQLRPNNDEFIRFVGLTKQGKLIAKIRTFDGGIIRIDIGAYNSFSKGRNDFYNNLNEINGYTNDFYNNTKTKMNIYIDDINLNSISSDVFKKQTYKSIVKFKENLTKNGDKFIRFVSLTNDGKLIAQIKTYDEGNIIIDIVNYLQWNKSRQDFYNKLKEVNGYTDDFYINNEIKISIYIDGIKLNPMKVNGFKTSTYKAIINLKNNLIKNGDEFIKFNGLTKGGSLIAQVKTFDGGIVNININNYNSWIKGRKDTYNYCEKKKYKLCSPYISARDKILIDFNCGHKSNWIKASNLKRGQYCPTCDESRGEKVIGLYLGNNNIDFIQEYKFNDCKYKYPLRFDFYIPEYNLCIEFDGVQHFEVNDFFGEKSFKDTQKRDKIKDKYCRDNGINLLRIPYYELDNIEKILSEEFNKLKK